MWESSTFGSGGCLSQVPGSIVVIADRREERQTFRTLMECPLSATAICTKSTGQKAVFGKTGAFLWGLLCGGVVCIETVIDKPKTLIESFHSRSRILSMIALYPLICNIHVTFLPRQSNNVGRVCHGENLPGIYISACQGLPGSKNTVRRYRLPDLIRLVPEFDREWKRA